MYESYYGFTGRPFQLNPDPRFYFDSSQHRRAMAFVQYGLHQGEGFIVVTGEVGAGKTTLLRSMLSSLDSEKVVAAHLVSTQLDAEDTLRMVAAAFGIRTRDQPKAELLLALEALLSAHASRGRRCLLIVDEAQNLAQRAVEELRMLSNFQLGTHALLQTFLVGQPEFRVILQSPEMSQLRQRVIAACHIGPLSLEETRQYIEHRLLRVGWKNMPTIAPDAYAALHEATGGVPRRINLLCDRLLLSGYLGERRHFTADSVHEVAGEIVGETGAVNPPPDGRVDAAVEAPRANVTDLPLRRAAEGPAEVRAPVEAGNALRAVRPANTYEVVSRPDTEALGGQLQQIERGMKDFEATLQRVERSNQDNVALFRRLLDLWRKAMVGKPPSGEG